MSLDRYVADGILSAGDVAVVDLVVGLASRAAGATLTTNELASLAMGLAVRAPRDGHTCVDLGEIDRWLDTAEMRIDPAAWLDSLATVPLLIGPPGAATPFTLDGDRLYTARSWAQETVVAERLAGEGGVEVSLLLGGPGSGKTTEVARRIVDRFTTSDVAPRLALAAPTGKAAARMNEALEARLRDLGSKVGTETMDRVLSFRARTVDALLGNNPNRHPRYRYHRDDPLPFDVVVVDEVSMMSSALMSRLLDALAPGTELLLVGDPDQLASVESGSVLADVVSSIRSGASTLADRTVTLTGQHRYPEGSAIARFVSAIRAANADEAIAILRQGAPDLRWVSTTRGDDHSAVLAEVVDHARAVCDLARSGDAAGALARVGAVQVLCAHRRGPDGVAGWNAAITDRLGTAALGPWYPGRPVMITRNDAPLRLANGDVGVTLAAVDGRRMVALGSPGEPRLLPATRLEQVTTVHALTIHKSQGSEYDHAVVVLPDESSRILTRELLYTAVSRARERLTVLGSEDVVRAAIGRPIRRATGLAERLTSR